MMFTLTTKQGHVDTFATAAAMSSAHGAYVASGIHVTPFVNGSMAIATMDESGSYTYHEMSTDSTDSWFDRYFA